MNSLLLGRVALAAQWPIVGKLFRERSVGQSVGLSSALWKNDGSDPETVWHHRSDVSRDEAGGGVWRSVHGKGYFEGKFGARHCPQGLIGCKCATAPRRGPLPKLLWADLFIKSFGLNDGQDNVHMYTRPQSVNRL